jgi:CDP-4-dehydro-6-deoxyglucose reductase
VSSSDEFLIRIESSGHLFKALPHETLLEAALRSGVNVNYSCSNGTCGDCRVRLLSGEVQESPADYTFSPVEKGEGYMLLCTSYAASDLVIAAQEAHTPEDIPIQTISAKIAKLEPRGEHVRILHLRTPRTKTLRFLAGQHVCLHLQEGSIDAAVASCPCNGMQLQFHLRHKSGVSFLERAFDSLGHGETVLIEGPFGGVTLDDDSPRPLLMVAVNEEFAPIKSLIEHAINLDITQAVRLFWLSGPDTGHYLENYCRAWGEVLDDYCYTPMSIAGREPNEREMTELGEAISAQMADLAQIDAYLAGPLSFQLALKQRLLERGADETRLFLPGRRSRHNSPLQRASGV